MPIRILEYVVRVWHRFGQEHPHEPRPVVIPVVLSHVPRGWSDATSLWDLVAPHPESIAGLADLVPKFRIVVQDLSAWTNEDIRTRVLADFPRLALWALRDARDAPRLLKNLEAYGPRPRPGECRSPLPEKKR
jgi:hypothetical protein